MNMKKLCNVVVAALLLAPAVVKEISSEDNEGSIEPTTIYVPVFPGCPLALLGNY